MSSLISHNENSPTDTFSFWAAEAERELLEATVGELESIAVLATVVTSLLNSVDRQGAISLPQRLSRFTPPEPTIVHSFLKLTIQPVRYADIAPDLAFFQLQLRSAKLHLTNVLETPAAFCSHEEIRQLTGSWRSICDVLLILLEKMSRSLTGETDQSAAQSELLDALRAARAGGNRASIAGEDGYPEWALRRRHRRVKVNTLGRATYLGRTYSIRVVDASIGGLGLAFNCNISPGNPMEVQMSCGRTFRGTVAWTAGNKVGLQLDQRLRFDDVLLSPD